MSATEYYIPTGNPGTGSAADSQPIRQEFITIQTGFGKLPNLSGNGGSPIRVNSAGTALEAVTIATMAGALGVTGTLNAPSGTVMLFQQSAAPTGWTKLTSNNDAALRVVSGTPGTGGTIAFSTAFSGTETTDGHTLVAAEIPSHTHGVNITSENNNVSHTHEAYWMGGSSSTPQNYPQQSQYASSISSTTTSTESQAHTHQVVGNTDGGTGGTGAHTHALSNLAVKYVDLILASKN